MKKIIFTFAIILTFIGTIFGQNLQHFNEDILGTKTSTAIEPLKKKQKNEIEPIQIRIDIKNKIYYAATIIFPESVSIQQATNSLNRFYKKYEKKEWRSNSKIRLWRNIHKKFGIQLSKNDEGNIQIIYINFMTTDKIIKAIKKAQK